MTLRGESGGDNTDRVREAGEILSRQGLADQTEQMKTHERQFVERMTELLDVSCVGDEPSISPKQLFYLRDLKDLYCV